jgi:hypothetical protein
MVKMCLRRSALAAAAGVCCLCAAASALTIQINYDYDTSGFFNPAVNPYASQARADLENAAKSYEMLTDHLLTIEEYGGNTWSARFSHPSTGATVYIPDLVVPEDTMIVYVGGRSLSSATLGQGGPGGYTAQAYEQAWFDLLKSRGQAGALTTPATDFGPWGGSISFNNTAAWNYSLDSGPSSGSQNDFFSTCLHELAHVLGYGSSASWQAQIVSTTFTGDAAEAIYGGPVPLAGSSHWGFDIQGLCGGVQQEVAMDPSLTTGTRKRLTDLDIAGLLDIGWQLPDAGDADVSGAIDAADYITLKRNMGNLSSATWFDGDFDFDGKVTWRDLALMETGLAAEAGAAEAAAAANQIPEPASLALLAAGAMAVTRPATRRRGRRVP